MTTISHARHGPLSWLLAGLFLGLVLSIAPHGTIPASARYAIPASARQAVIPRGGTLIVAEQDSPDTLNPYLTRFTGSNVSYDIAGSVFDSLVYMDDRGRYVDDLATGYSHDRSGLHWTFDLVHNATWQDGAPLTASDVVFTTKLVMNPKFPSNTVSGFDHVKSIRAIGKYRVAVTLTAVYAPFFYDWATAPILPQHVLGRVDPAKIVNLTSFNRRPVGSGPFKIADFAPGDHVTALANRRYFRGAPHLDHIIFRVVPDSNTALNEIRTGEVNLVGPTLVSAQQFNLLIKLYQRGGQSGVKVYASRSYKFSHVDLIESGFLKDRLVRRALAYATPRRQIIAAVALGYGDLADGDEPPFSPWYNPRIYDSYPFNIARARGVLLHDGFAPGPDGVLRKGGKSFNLTLWGASGDHDHVLIAQILQRTWGQLGVHVTIKLADVNTLFSSPHSPLSDPKRLSSPTMNAVVDWTLDIPEPDDSFFWSSSQIGSATTPAGGNADGYRNPVVDRLLEQGLQTLDQRTRAAIYRQVQQIIAADEPDVFLYWSRLLSAATSRLHGYDPQPYDNVLTWNVKDWYLAR